MRFLIWDIDLQNKATRLKLTIIVGAVVIALFLIFAGALKATMSPTFCSMCHEMTPEYVTWKASSHSKIACTDCHIEPGLINLLVHKASASKELYAHFAKSYKRPIKMAHKLPDLVCKQCHSDFRKFENYSGDLIVPHIKHGKKGIHCVECHGGVAHGNVVARKVTATGDYAAWTEQKGQGEMAKDYTEPKMSVCMDCHNKNKVNNACEACHSAITLPSDHKAASWGTTHGKKALKDIPYCNKCHSYSLTVNPKQITIQKYARENSFCHDCHNQWPPSHKKGEWAMTHSQGARSNDDGCFICHSDSKPKDTEKVTKTYCKQCHEDNVHPGDWRKQHPKFIKESGIAKGNCFKCHDSAHCSTCHMKSGRF